LDPPESFFWNTAKNPPPLGFPPSVGNDLISYHLNLPQVLGRFFSFIPGCPWRPSSVLFLGCVNAIPPLARTRTAFLTPSVPPPKTLALSGRQGPRVSRAFFSPLEGEISPWSAAVSILFPFPFFSLFFCFLHRVFKRLTPPVRAQPSSRQPFFPSAPFFLISSPSPFAGVRFFLRAPSVPPSPFVFVFSVSPGPDLLSLAVHGQGPNHIAYLFSRVAQSSFAFGKDHRLSYDVPDFFDPPLYFALGHTLFMSGLFLRHIRTPSLGWFLSPDFAPLRHRSWNPVSFPLRSLLLQLAFVPLFPCRFFQSSLFFLRGQGTLIPSSLLSFVTQACLLHKFFPPPRFFFFFQCPNDPQPSPPGSPLRFCGSAPPDGPKMPSAFWFWMEGAPPSPGGPLFLTGATLCSPSQKDPSPSPVFLFAWGHRYLWTSSYINPPPYVPFPFRIVFCFFFGASRSVRLLGFSASRFFPRR